MLVFGVADDEDGGAVVVMIGFVVLVGLEPVPEGRAQNFTMPPPQTVTVMMSDDVSKCG